MFEINYIHIFKHTYKVEFIHVVIISEEEKTWCMCECVCVLRDGFRRLGGIETFTLESMYFCVLLIFLNQHAFVSYFVMRTYLN